MWSHRDPDARRSGIGNVFVKNLSDGIDNVALQDMFRKFGNVLFCKVAMFEDGKSKGYSFVQFESEESALAATDKLNGFTVADKQLCDDVQEKHRVIGNGAMDEYKNDNGLLCGTSELGVKQNIRVSMTSLAGAMGSSRFIFPLLVRMFTGMLLLGSGTS